MRAFPAAPCCVDVDDRLRALAPSAECPIAEENLARGLLDLGHAGRVGISCTRSAARGLLSASCPNWLYRECGLPRLFAGKMGGVRGGEDRCRITFLECELLYLL